MSGPRRYFRTIVRVEVLSEGAPWEGELEGLYTDITDGPCSGMRLEDEVTELTEAEMATALEGQASDPDFLLRSDEWLNPILQGDEVMYLGEAWEVVASPDGTGPEPNAQASSNDIVSLKRGPAWETRDAYRHELS